MDAVGCLILFGKAVYVPFMKGGNKFVNNGMKHVGGEFCVVSNGVLNGSRREWCGWCFSHNGCELVGGDGEGQHSRMGRPLLWQFKEHTGVDRHVLAVVAAVVVAAKVPVLDGMVVVSFDR